jgi:DNA-binding NtrC family response regulator
MDKRNVLVLDPAGTLRTELQQFEPSSIALHYARSVADAKPVLFDKDCTVGLVMFDVPPVLVQEEMEQLVAGSPATEWIAMVASRAVADEASWVFVLNSFHDYHTLPADPQRLAMAIGHAHGKASLRRFLARAQQVSERFGIYGASPVMLDFFRQLEKVVKADLPVLIGGESGTGKELVSQAIHRYSRRSDGPFVVVNCGAIPGGLIQSELFGHERGAFTGALQRKIGSIEAAHGGVLFLDEIGDLPMELQANLLRVLQERTVIRLGSNQPVPVNCRLVAATHVDLQKAVAAGTFREDLYYRLNVIHLKLPPLRERSGDIQLLAEVVLRKFAAANKSRVVGFATEALRAMNAYPWPGNVRELINRVHSAVIMSENRLISAADLGLESHVPARQGISLENARASFERDMIEASLRANGNNMTLAARQLGVSRVTLYRILNRPAAS